jgi:hypothetical protein
MYGIGYAQLYSCCFEHAEFHIVVVSFVIALRMLLFIFPFHGDMFLGG